MLAQHSWIDNCICSAFRRFNFGLWQHCLGMKLSKFVRLYVYDYVKKVPRTWQPELATSVCQKVLARNSRKLFFSFVQEQVLFRLPVELSFIHATPQRTESSCEVSQSLSGVSPVLRREPNLDAFPYPLDLPLLHFEHCVRDVCTGQSHYCISRKLWCQGTSYSCSCTFQAWRENYTKTLRFTLQFTIAVKPLMLWLCCSCFCIFVSC